MKAYSEKLLSPSEVMQLLNVPRYKLVYLFDARKLKAEDFLTLGNGRRVFRESDLEKIKEALWEIGAK